MSVALVQDIRLDSNADVCLFLRAGQFDLEPLIITRTPYNSFLDFQQIFSFTPVLVENLYSATKRNRTNLFMSLNLAPTMITLRQTVAPKNDPDLARDNQNLAHATITYTSSAIHVLVEGF